MSTFDAHIFHRAHVKFDRRFRVDHHSYFPIPYTITHSTTFSSRVGGTTNGLHTSVSQELIGPGDRIRVELQSLSPLETREIRIEFVAEIIMEIGHAAKTAVEVTVLDRVRNIYEFPRYIVLPKFLELSETKGRWVVCNTFVKIVVDRALKADINIKFPVHYIQCLAKE